MARQQRIAAKYRATTRSDPQQLRFDSRRIIQRAALSDRRTGRNAVSISFTLSVFTNRQLSVMVADRELRARWNRLVRNFAAILQRRARQLSRPTYDTGLFSSSWDARVTGSGLLLRVALENQAPYAGYVHRRGQRETVLERYIKPMVRKETERFLGDILPPDGPLTGPIKDAVLAGLLDGAT